MKSAFCNLPSAISAVLLLNLTCCRPAARDLADVSASDEWTRTYELAPGGEVIVLNKNGPVVVEGRAGTSVEVTATRSSKAKSAKTANEILPRITIVEDIKPDRVSVRTAGIEGILVGVTFEVAYHVKVPPGAKVRAQTGNGDVTVTGIDGALLAVSANGSVRGVGLSGGVEARTSNGKVIVDMRSLGVDPIALRTMNGSVELALPESAKASLSASSRNGTISTGTLAFESTSDPERGRSPRLRGRINGGGTPIDLQTMNGNVSLSVRTPPPAQD